MKITETENEIILRDVPLGDWLLGAFILFVFGLFAVGLTAVFLESPRDFLSSNDGGWLGSVFAVLMFILLVAFILLMFAVAVGFIFSPVINTKIERKAQTVVITRTFFRHKRTKRFFFSQIKRFNGKKVNARGAPLYSIALMLKNNSQIDLENGNHRKSESDEIIARLNSFLNQAR